jgi:hypothetical protein
MIAADDARGLLPTVLLCEQTEISQVDCVWMAVDAKQPAMVLNGWKFHAEAIPL